LTVTDGKFDHNFWYIGYAIFVKISTLIYNSPGSIIFFQVSFYLVGLIFLYLVSHKVWGTYDYAFITTISYILFVDVTQWNFYVLAESFYVSFSIIILYAVTQYKGENRQILLLSLVIGFGFLIKPTGIAFIVSGICFFIGYHLRSRKINKSLIGLSIITLIILMGILVNKMLATFIDQTLEEVYVKGEIIFAITYIQNHPDINLLTISSNHIELPSKDLPPLIRLLWFVVLNPIFF
jgi:hypothetical protein